jgi:16S rRNA (guanine527-N7)-methyltransferase
LSFFVALQAPFSAREIANQTWALDLPTGLDERLELLAELLLDANQRLNLTGITEPREVWERHFLDSLSVAPLATDLPAGAEIVDVGAGAGFPGLVLALALPALQVTLVEATARKVEFIRHAAELLGLRNVRALAARAEELGASPDHRERYDAAVARAVASTAGLVELLAPLLRVTGQLWLMKTADAAKAELAQAQPALQALDCEARTIQPTDAAGYLAGRCVIVLEKRSPTPVRFPRRPGMAQKRPLAGGADEATVRQ